MRERLTTAAELLGAVLVSLGALLTFGVGPGCITTGVLLLAGSWLVERTAE